MNIFERIAEAKIRKAEADGEFENLAGRGRPLRLDDMRGVPAEDRAGYRLLRNAGFAPEEVGARRELARIDAEMARAEADPGRYEVLRRQRLALELKRDLAADRRLGRL